MERAAPEGVWQYKGSWRSTAGSLTLFFLFFAALFVLVALLAGGRGAFGFGLAALTMFGFAWLMGRPLLTSEWVLRIGPRGISGWMLNQRTVPWRDLRDVNVEVVQGNSTVVLQLDPAATESLAKTRRRFGGRKPERRIPLILLKPDQVKDATEALARAFAAGGGARAVAAVQAREDEARRAAAFQDDLVRRTPLTWALYAIVALNVGVWLANVLSGISAINASAADLFRWGANSAWAVMREHEYWRLLTATFLHGSLLHLGMNMLGLWGAGRLLNRLYGNGRFLLIYFASALAGSAASLHFAAQTAVSVGASGAVFGVLGALVATARLQRGRLPRALGKQIVGSEGVFIVYALFNGFARQGIDNAAHVGGLLAGAAMAWMLAGVLDEAAAGRRQRRAAQAAAAMLVAVVAGVLTTPAPRVDHATSLAAEQELRRVLPRVGAAHDALRQDGLAVQAGRMTEQELEQKVQRVHLPALRAAYEELARVPKAQGDPRAQAAAELQRLTGKSVELLELELRVSRGEAAADAPARLQQLKREAEQSMARLRELMPAATGKKPA